VHKDGFTFTSYLVIPVRSEINLSRFRYQYIPKSLIHFLHYTIDEVKLSEISPTSKLGAKSLGVKRVKRDFGIGIATHTVKYFGNYLSMLLQNLLVNLW
jgi:hypothetical protein